MNRRRGRTGSCAARDPACASAWPSRSGSVAAATLAIYPLGHVAPVVSLSVVYLPAVLLVSTYWGLGLGRAHRDC